MELAKVQYFRDNCLGLLNEFGKYLEKLQQIRSARIFRVTI